MEAYALYLYCRCSVSRFFQLVQIFFRMTSQDENTPLLSHKQSINTEDEDTSVTILTPRKLCVICVYLAGPLKMPGL